MTCTKKKKCLYGDICPTARSNEYNLINASCYKPLEQTNEQWFDSQTTKKKAKIIKMVINICISCKEHKTIMTKGCPLRQKMAKNLLFLPCMDENGICEWLKQPRQKENRK